MKRYLLNEVPQARVFAFFVPFCGISLVFLDDAMNRKFCVRASSVMTLMTCEFCHACDPHMKHHGRSVSGSWSEIYS